MSFVFGSTFVCTDMDTAKQVTPNTQLWPSTSRFLTLFQNSSDCVFTSMRDMCSRCFQVLLFQLPTSYLSFTIVLSLACSNTC